MIYEVNIAVSAIQNCLSKRPGLQCRACAWGVGHSCPHLSSPHSSSGTKDLLLLFPFFCVHIFSFSPLQVKNKPRHDVANVHLFLNLVLPRTVHAAIGLT